MVPDLGPKVKSKWGVARPFDISFDAARSVLEVKGYSYPENAVAFYAPVLEWLQEYLGGARRRPVEINMELIYFNSSSSKILLDLFDFLDEHAAAGIDVEVNWIYDENNESAYECGLEFQEGLRRLRFALVRKSA